MSREIYITTVFVTPHLFYDLVRIVEAASRSPGTVTYLSSYLTQCSLILGPQPHTQLCGPANLRSNTRVWGAGTITVIFPLLEVETKDEPLWL